MFRVLEASCFYQVGQSVFVVVKAECFVASSSIALGIFSFLSWCEHCLVWLCGELNGPSSTPIGSMDFWLQHQPSCGLVCCTHAACLGYCSVALNPKCSFSGFNVLLSFLVESKQLVMNLDQDACFLSPLLG